MRIFLAPYNMRVSAAREICTRINAKRIVPIGGRYVPRRGDVVINWGRSTLPDFGVRVINDPASVSVAVDKLLTLAAFEANDIPHAEWTVDPIAARRWLNTGGTVLHRAVVRGRAGSGIAVLSGRVADIGNRGFWSLYEKKRAEYRVHVINGVVVDVQQKRKKRGEKSDPKVRSHLNGWVFCRESVEAPKQVLDASIRALAAVGLDFGALDVGWNEKKQRPCVYEVNSAPGIEGTTIERYADALLAMTREQ
jgi:glutathione synthase/RimK-type ligase-like ATP-grasp enzyme